MRKNKLNYCLLGGLSLLCLTTAHVIPMQEGVCYFKHDIDVPLALYGTSMDDVKRLTKGKDGVIIPPMMSWQIDYDANQDMRAIIKIGWCETGKLINGTNKKEIKECEVISVNSDIRQNGVVQKNGTTLNSYGLFRLSKIKLKPPASSTPILFVPHKKEPKTPLKEKDIVSLESKGTKLTGWQVQEWVLPYAPSVINIIKKQRTDLICYTLSQNDPNLKEQIAGKGATSTGDNEQKGEKKPEDSAKIHIPPYLLGDDSEEEPDEDPPSPPPSPKKP